MPNAETHLTAACDLLAEPEIARAYPWLAGEASRAAFLMGAISPDVRVVSDISRDATHFFTIPPADDRPAPAVMRAVWPQIATAVKITAQNAAFVAGYMTHLIMDQTWVEVVIMPELYIDGQPWVPSHPNWRLYCILMAYLEYRAAGRMPAGTLEQLMLARPDRWLPFVPDSDLVKWRDRVVSVVRKGGPRLISSSLVKSCGLSAEAMEAIIGSEAAMAREAYPTMAKDQLLAFKAETARRSRDQVMAYLAGTSDVFS